MLGSCMQTRMPTGSPWSWACTRTSSGDGSHSRVKERAQAAGGPERADRDDAVPGQSLASHRGPKGHPSPASGGKAIEAGRGGGRRYDVRSRWRSGSPRRAGGGRSGAMSCYCCPVQGLGV